MWCNHQKYIHIHTHGNKRTINLKRELSLKPLKPIFIKHYLLLSAGTRYEDQSSGTVDTERHRTGNAGHSGSGKSHQQQSGFHQDEEEAAGDQEEAATPVLPQHRVLLEKKVD